jgi:hypothetical protein
VLGSIGTFQDVPLSLQIVVRSAFFELHRHGEHLDCDSEDAGDVVAARSMSAEHLKNVEAASDLLLWLSEGETALVASRTAEKERKNKESESKSSSQIEESQTEAPPEHSEGNESVGLDDATKQILSSVDNILSSKGPELDTDASLIQPPAMARCFELKRYGSHCVVLQPQLPS